MLFELHCHSTFSDGRATPAEIIDYAKAIGLGGIAITDHDAIAGSLSALSYATEGFRVISGMEVSSVEGHILGLGIREVVPKDMSAAETVERIHALGGLAVAAHPYDRWRQGVGDLILTLPFDAVEVLNGHTFGNRKNPVSVCEKAGLTMVGGSDAHTLSEVGMVKVEFEGELAGALKSKAVRIRSKSTPHLIINHGIGLMKRKIIRDLLKTPKK
jgi:predicted metal-dependent phosphoesterase TrpH